MIRPIGYDDLTARDNLTLDTWLRDDWRGDLDGLPAPEAAWRYPA